jgi:hypothetical protein
MTTIHCHLCGGVVSDWARIAYRPPRASAQIAMPHGGLCECARPAVHEDPPVIWIAGVGLGDVE